jgi:hypothetical protein
MDLDLGVLGTVLSKLSTDPSSSHFTDHPALCTPLCMNHATRMLLLKQIPILDDIYIVARQRGDESCSVCIPGTDVVDGRRGADTTTGSGKGKEKVAPSWFAPKAGS